MAKKILVSGANGQLGTEIREISENSIHTFIFSDIDTIDFTREKPALGFLNSHKPDVIVNCAAYTAVDKAEEEWDKAEKINAGIPAMLANYGTESACRIIHISTDYVFPGNIARPLHENDLPAPLSRYGLSKLNGENALREYDKHIIIRTSWLYSGFGNNFVKSMMKLFRERKELKVVFDQVGTPTYAADLAEIILRFIDLPDPDFKPGTYNYSNEGVASWYDFAIEIRDLTGSACNILPIETKDFQLPASRPAYAVLNKEKIKHHLGIEIPHWTSSLKRCIEKINRT